LLVIPAIDIKDGNCVRLKQGKMTDETVFSDNPVEIAVKWFHQGAERLHLVDLNGAVQGKAVNEEVIEGIIGAVPIPVQLGGGIRDLRTLSVYMRMGLEYVILGTAAHKDPTFVTLACREFPGHIMIGIDARKDRVAVEGWTEETHLTPLETAREFEGVGVSAVIYTDIQRDGMRTGPNVAGTRDLARSIDIPVIASGGISGISDVLDLLPLAEDGVLGMITGRALYDGSLDLTEAMNVAREKAQN
jgi:phosphoribosylformimino-5-aminoimidazole carboxamide ribotide isomerase